MTRAEVSERFWIVARRGLERADREHAAHLAAIRPAARLTRANIRAHVGWLLVGRPRRRRSP